MSKKNRPNTTAQVEQYDVRPSTVVVESIADAENVDAADLPPLYERIDPDALDDFVAEGGDDPRRVEFGFAGYEVTVEGDGTVSVDALD